MARGKQQPKFEIKKKERNPCLRRCLRHGRTDGQTMAEWTDDGQIAISWALLTWSSRAKNRKFKYHSCIQFLKIVDTFNWCLSRRLDREFQFCQFRSISVLSKWCLTWLYNKDYVHGRQCLSNSRKTLAPGDNRTLYAKTKCTIFRVAEEYHLALSMGPQKTSAVA